MGLYEEAAQAWQKTQILAGASEEEVTGLSEAAARGREGYWRWQLDYWTERARQEYVSARTFAMVYAQLGEKDMAFEWLEKLYEERGPLNYLNVDGELDPLRDDPRFTDLLRRMNLAP